MKKVAEAPRTRNPRGEGTRLRGDIVAAAYRLIAAGGVEAVTLRGVAREVGIAAPSIYAHFDDLEAVIEGVVADAFGVLRAKLEQSIEPHDDPAERLRAGCHGYLDFATENPQIYQLLFGPLCPESAREEGLATFEVLVRGIRDAVERGRSKSTDPFADATNVWAALHGIATLRLFGHGSFPWPPLEDTLETIVCRLALVDPV